MTAGRFSSCLPPLLRRPGKVRAFGDRPQAPGPRAGAIRKAVLISMLPKRALVCGPLCARTRGRVRSDRDAHRHGGSRGG